MIEIGYNYLIKHYRLKVCPPILQSWLVLESQKSSGLHAEGHQWVKYPAARFKTGEKWDEQLCFALKHEGVNLEVMQALFEVIDRDEVTQRIQSKPTSAYSRKIWFFYEFLTETPLSLPDVKTGNYVHALNPDSYVTLPDSHATYVKRCRVVNNLLGTVQGCPLVRKTAALMSFPESQIQQRCAEVMAAYSPDLIYRAVQYLYIKETKSSFAIERETPDQKRQEQFVTLLKDVKRQAIFSLKGFAELQQLIVDPRYAQAGWRTDQVYVGETITPLHERVHYIAPQPKDIPALMTAYCEMAEKILCSGVDAIVAAVILSFAFVFLHPFDDGNGRIHRYLLHYIMARRGVTPEGTIFPVSALLHKHAHRYDRILESFSKPLMAQLNYTLSPSGEVTVVGESVQHYRFIDFTTIVEEMQRVIQETIETEWKAELDYLKAYDEARQSMRQVVDMPEKKANQLIRFVQQNGGTLSKTKGSSRFVEKR